MRNDDEVPADNPAGREAIGPPGRAHRAPADKQGIALAVWTPERVRTTGEGEIARVAGRQHEVIHREQLLAAGVGRSAISYRLQAGRLHRRQRSVYSLTPGPLTLMGEATAAILTFRGDAVLDSTIAAVLWGWLEVRRPPISVSVVGQRGHDRGGCAVHRVASLDRADVRNRKGLPVTSPGRTLFDRAGRLDDLELENEVVGAHRVTGVRPAEILRAIERAPHRAGAARLRRIVVRLQQGPETVAATRSRWERRLLKLILDADLPRPVTNVIVEGHRVDMVWVDRRLVVEFDSRRFHSDPAAFETDRLRDARLIAAGYTVMRITEDQLEHAPLAVIARLSAALTVARAA